MSEPACTCDVTDDDEPVACVLHDACDHQWMVSMKDQSKDVCVNCDAVREVKP